MASKDELARSFGAEAATYEAARPEYPRAAVDWALEPIQAEYSNVVDVGAGTGKLTRVLVATGAEVVAVEPDPEMATELNERVPGVETYLGTGERLPLPDASADAVTYGQAWHWVDAERASAEAARVLRPGGVLALFWNVRDEEVEWVARLTGIMRGSSAERFLGSLDELTLPAPFGTLEERRFRWSTPMTAEAILDLVHSRSYVITAPPEERARIDREVGELLAGLGVGGGTTIDMPYVTRVFRGIRS